MYRPPLEPQLRPRAAAVPPPPPPGMANYALPRPLPPPLYGRPFSMSQFSYSVPATGPPPFASQPGQSFQMQPSSGLQVRPFVPPLPSDLPPPPPSSPPPSPPPLPSECMVGSTKHVGHSGLPPYKTGTPLCDGEYHTSNQQESSLPRTQSVAENEASHRLDPGMRQQQDIGWNATYQDTLDEGAGSASDMDMDLEDHLGVSTTKVALDEVLNSGPTHYPPRSNDVKREDDRSNQEGLGMREGQVNADTSLYDARTADQSKVSVSGFAKEHQISGGNEDKQLEWNVSRDDAMEQGFGFGHGRSRTSMLTKEGSRARSSRWGSPTRVQNKDDDHELLMPCSGNLEHLPSSCNTADDTSRNSQQRHSPNRIVDGSLTFEVPASVERAIDVPTAPQRPDNANQMANQSSEIDTRSNAVQQREKQDPKVDEFGRLVQEGVSDSESEGHRLPLVESGRVASKGGSASKSEDDRRSLKRKRRYSRSRSRSRVSIGSRSRSRSRSRSSTSKSRGSRSPTRSPGDRRWRRRSFSRSPHWKPRWNRSRSRSPYSRRSYSRSPPRDSRRRGMIRGERDWRGDRDYFGRGRRGGRGGGANTCFHYARGRCLRGSSCRFLHVSRDSPMQDQGGWRRDDQFERHNFRDGDDARESHMIDRQDREKFAREPWSERHDDWDAGSPDVVGERQGRENAGILPQEEGWDVGGQLPADRFTSLTPAIESWVPAESKHAQFMGSCDRREGYGGMRPASIERDVGAAEQAGTSHSKEWSVLDTMDKMENVSQSVEVVAIKADKEDCVEEVGARNQRGDGDSIEIEKEVVEESDVEVRQDDRSATNGGMDIEDDMKLSPETGELGPKQEIGSPHGAMVVPEAHGNYDVDVKLEDVDEVDVSKDTPSLGDKAQVGKDSSLLSMHVKSEEEGRPVVLEEVVEKPTLAIAKGVKAEVSQSLPVGIISPLEPSGPQAQEISVGHPASRPPGMLPPPVSPLLPTPVGQHNMCIGQPVFPQGQQHIPQGQQAIPIGQAHPRQPMGPTQQGMFARNLPRATPYGSCRPPLSNVPSSNLGDQTVGQIAMLNSGNTGYLPVAVGWGQLSLLPRAPGQEIMPFTQAHGPSNYGRPSLGPLPFGVPFFGPPPPPNSGDQGTKHHGQPDATEQYLQQLGPGFGPSNPGVPFSQKQQHGMPADVGAPFSQHHLALPNAAAPCPPQHAPSQMHRPPSHGGTPYLPYVYPQPSTQQAGHMNQYATTPTVSAISQPLLLATQQGLGSTPSQLPEQPRPFGGATPSQFHAATSMGLLMNPPFSLSLPPPQSAVPWDYSAAQVPVPLPTDRSYAYPLTTIPPLSSLVQVPQTTNPPSQSNQYDPLSDIPGSNGSPKGSVKAPEAAVAISTGGTSIAEPLNPSKANAQAGETTAPLVAPFDPPMNGADIKSTKEAAADAEILSPENWSPVQPVEGTEPGQEQQALSKKGSRGLKMLRAAIAEHVKEVLKPTWKEGYMSKEAFKTIAKKAVEKVIGNVPSHHIPKTQEKVDQYMKASRSKISKLVQGYVDKYLKL